MTRMSKSDWLKLDWSKSNKELSNITGKTISTVNTMRYRLDKTKRKQTQAYTGWSKVDWSKNNTELAKELNLSYDTVAKRRYQTKEATKADSRAVRKDKGISKTTYIPPPEQQAKATKSAQKSPIAGRSESNIHAKEWVLASPDNKIYRITNLHHFIRNNPHLFNDKDVVWKRKGGKRGSGGEYCNASAGLSNVRSGKSESWKGWSLRSKA